MSTEMTTDQQIRKAVEQFNTCHIPKITEVQANFIRNLVDEIMERHNPRLYSGLGMEDTIYFEPKGKSFIHWLKSIFKANK